MAEEAPTPRPAFWGWQGRLSWQGLALLAEGRRQFPGFREVVVEGGAGPGRKPLPLLLGHLSFSFEVCSTSKQ